MECRATQSGKTLLRVNLDETAIRLFCEPAKGSVVLRPDWSRREPNRVRMRASKSLRRGSFTHVAAVCDCSSLQPFIPQAFLGGHNVILQRDVNAVLDDLPHNAYLLRKDNGWADQESLAVVLKLLSRAIRTRCGEQVQPALLMDTFAAHLSPAFLRACRRSGFWVIFVPASTTWLLQPLDTHVFASYKRQLERSFRQSQIASADGVVTTQSVLRIAATTARKVFASRKWSAAFDACGFGCNQTRLGSRCAALSEKLHVERPAKPSHDETTVRTVLPKRKKPLMALMAPEFTLSKVAADSAGQTSHAECLPCASTSANEHVPWSKRLRSSAAIGSGQEIATPSNLQSTSAEGEPCPVAQNSEPKRQVPRAVRLPSANQLVSASQSGHLLPKSGKK